jgi:outer membrane lipoprotein-sorting protein
MTPAARLGFFPCALALAACGAAPPRSVFPTADDALGRMRATYACANGVQGEAKIDNFSPKGRVRGDLILTAVVPDRVRFDVVSFGTTLYTLASDGDRFQMLDVKEKQFLHGPSSPCNLARLTQVPVPGHALVALLRGEAPVLVHQPAGATIAWDSGGFYRIALSSTREATEEIHLEVRPSDFDRPWGEQRVRVTDVVVRQRGIDLYHADLRNHKPTQTATTRTDPDGIDPDVPAIGPVCDAELPWSIHMAVPNTEQDVIFQYKEAKWNPAIIPGAFKIDPPGGVRTVFVTCGKEAKP